MQGRLEADLKSHAHKLQLMVCNLLVMHKKLQNMYKRTR